MTVTLNPNVNGKVQRKNLASQLDRLDNILDGLDQALQGAITDAVKEAVSTAVSEAVRATLVEIVSNPDVITLLRGVVPAATEKTEQEAQPVEQKKTILGRARDFVSGAWNRSLSKVRDIGSSIAKRVRKVRDDAIATYTAAKTILPAGRIVRTALGVGVVVGVACLIVPQTVSAAVSAVTAATTAVAIQMASWMKRAHRSFGLVN